MVELVPIFRHREYVKLLYDLLSERTPRQSISHQDMPSIEEHEQFVRSQPYLAWYFVQVNEDIVGSIYITQQREIGVFIFRKYFGFGYGKQAVEAIMQRHTGPFFANINPLNEVSRKMFEELGFTLIQHTYRLG